MNAHEKKELPEITRRQFLYLSAAIAGSLPMLIGCKSSPLHQTASLTSSPVPATSTPAPTNTYTLIPTTATPAPTNTSTLILPTKTSTGTPVPLTDTPTPTLSPSPEAGALLEELKQTLIVGRSSDSIILDVAAATDGPSWRVGGEILDTLTCLEGTSTG
jgi:hypothetical protein